MKKSRSRERRWQRIRYYSDYVRKNPKYELVDIYADEEIIYGGQY